jgi:hypothetical protein
LSRKTSKTPSSAAQARTPLLRIGPGLVIAVILAVIIGGNAIKDKLPQQKSTSGPIIENRIVGGSSNPAPPTLDVGFLLTHSDKLGLTPKQVSALNTLNRKYQSTYGPKLKQAKAEADKLKSLLAKSGNGTTPVASIQQQAAPYVALSSQISQGRRQYWSRAMTLLTPKQREKVLALRKARSPGR